LSAELVIFDCDGVLVDSEPISNAVLARLLGEQGLRVSVAEARRAYQGLTLAHVLASAEATLGLARRFCTKTETAAGRAAPQQLCRSRTTLDA
jgi:beta-phosphoglucomutase-like phosphatase (HAD superfamily)